MEVHLVLQAFLLGTDPLQDHPLMAVHIAGIALLGTVILLFVVVVEFLVVVQILAGLFRPVVHQICLQALDHLCRYLDRHSGVLRLDRQ